MQEGERASGDAPERRFVVVGGAPARRDDDAQGASSETLRVPDDRPLGKALAMALTLRATLQRQAVEWCQDRSWEVRVPLLLYFAWVLVHHWGNIEYQSLLGGLNLGIHEAGHILFRPLGEFMMLAGGTILQCLAPVGAMLVFYKQRDFFAIAFCYGWLATNLFHCATYANDARGQLNLILVSPWGQGFGADGIGDWSRMLGKLGMLEWDTTIAFWFRVAANLSMATCFVLGAWLLWQMHRSRGGGPAATRRPGP